MPNCDFYALGDDFTKVLDFVFSQEGWVLHELSSEPDCEIRCFDSTAALLQARPLGARAQHFQLHAPEMGSNARYRKITFKEGAVPGHTHRYFTDGWGLIQLYFGCLQPNGALSPCHTNHNSEVRAKAWASQFPEMGSPSVWGWTAVSRVSGKLNRFIRNAGVGKVGARPVLPGAQAAVTAGGVRLGLARA